MSRLLSLPPVRRSLQPLRVRLTAHTTRVAQAQSKPVRDQVNALSKRLDEQSAQLARVSSQLTKLLREHAATKSTLDELAGRFEALRFRYETLAGAGDGATTATDSTLSSAP